MDRAALSPLLRSFERHLRAENRSERTIASYLQSARQAETFLAGRGTSLTAASRADLEAFLGDLPGRRHGGHPLQGAANPVPLAGGRGRGQPDGQDAPADRP